MITNDQTITMTASFELPMEVAPFKIVKFFLSRPVTCNVSQAAEAYCEAFEFCRDAVEEQAIAYAEAVGCKPPVTTRTPLTNGKPAPVKEKGDASNAAFQQAAKAKSSHEAATEEACPMCDGHGTLQEAHEGEQCGTCHGSGSVTVSQGKRGDPPPPVIADRIAVAAAANAERKASLEAPGVLPPLSVVPVAPVHALPPVTTKVEEAELTAIAAGKKRKNSKAGTVKANPTLPPDLDAMEASADALLASREPAVAREAAPLGVVMGDALRSAETSSQAAQPSPAATAGPEGTMVSSPQGEKIQPVQDQKTRFIALRDRVAKTLKCDDATAGEKVSQFRQAFTGKGNFSDCPENEPCLDALTAIVGMLEQKLSDAFDLKDKPRECGLACRAGYQNIRDYCKRHEFSLELRDNILTAAKLRYAVRPDDILEFLNVPDPASRVLAILEGA